MKHNRFNIIDLEATCWDGTEEGFQGTSEIIQLGIVQVDLHERACTRSGEKLFRPVMSRVSPYCTQLTGITPEQLADAPLFNRAWYSIKVEWNLLEYPWASWGEYDRTMLHDTLKHWNAFNGFPMDFLSVPHINLKAAFSTFHPRSKGHSINSALEACGLDFLGTPHRAMDDAHNAARIWLHVTKGKDA